MNILYVCIPFDVHDRKWMTYFAAKPGFKLFATWEDHFDKDTTQADYDVFKANNITTLPSFPTFTFKNPITSYKSIRHLNKLIKENNIDVVHLLFATPHAIWGAFIKVPHVITARGSDVLIVIPKLRTEGSGLKKLQNRLLFNIFHRSFTKASLITGTSGRQVESIKKVLNPPCPVDLIRTGVDVDAISNIKDDSLLPEELKGRKFVFSPRYLKPMYNPELQLAAIRLLPKHILQEYKFVFIYGAGEYYENKKKELAQIEGLDYIIYERLSQQQMWTCYKYSSLTFMVPHSDGTPNTALEAMAARCPLILRDLEVYDKLIFDGCCLKLPDAEPQTLADTIVQALENYPQELLDISFDRVSKHGNRKVEMEKLYKRYLEIEHQ